MSILTKALGFDGARERRDAQKWAAYGGTPDTQLQQALLDEKNGTGYKTAFNDTAGAFLNEQMPDLLNNLQLTREQGIRRGISTGDLGTSNEGDLVSAFQRNLATALGGLSLQGYESNRNRYLDLLTGKIAGDQAYKSDQRNSLAGLLGSGLNAAASYYGAKA